MYESTRGMHQPVIGTPNPALKLILGRLPTGPENEPSRQLNARHCQASAIKSRKSKI
ncbi:MAG TPA: hypothetical protein IGS37_09675 [Synechococcales cyanobacterium M55_K2018_004]|nr:hypothetical protein [Synechococcales cyanobacterium M55_K2018_004]